VLLDGERMRVYADADQAFRVEGVYRLALENGTDRNLNDSGRFDCLVAGGAQRPRVSVLPVPLSLPVVGRVEPRAA
jgi:hypothetical protein